MKGAAAVVPGVATLTGALFAAAAGDASLTFVDAAEAERCVPLAEVRDRALTIAGGLLARGVRSGDRVALILPTCPEFVYCFFGALCAGAIPVPLYPPVRLGRLTEYHRRTAAMLSSVGAAVMITDERIRRFLGVAEKQAAPRLGCITAAELADAPADPVALAGDDVALIQFSSGTTNDPKPVALTHRNLLFNLAAIAERVGYREMAAPVGVSWLPLYHDMGLIGNLLTAFYGPVPMVLLPPELFVARPAAWLRAVSRHRAVCSAAPSFAYGLCADRIRDDELDGVDLTSWQLCLNGAEAVSAAVQRRFADRFQPWGFDPAAFAPCYGLAEASLAVTFHRAGRSVRTVGVDTDILAQTGIVVPGDKELVSVGRPLAGVEVQIRDGDQQPLPADQAGGIFVRGPSVMSGYYGRPDLTDAVLSDGWLSTGDRGFVHDDELFVCGRQKDTVIIRGANHAPQEFEAALDGLAGVRPGCAVAVGFTPGDDEALAMLVEVTADAPAGLADAVASRVWEQTQILPARIELLAPGTLPRTSSGKLRRGAARAQWLAGELTAPDKVTATRLLMHAAKGQFNHALATRNRRNGRKPSDPGRDTAALPARGGQGRVR